MATRRRRLIVIYTGDQKINGSIDSLASELCERFEIVGGGVVATTVLHPTWFASRLENLLEDCAEPVDNALVIVDRPDQTAIGLRHVLECRGWPNVVYVVAADTDFKTGEQKVAIEHALKVSRGSLPANLITFIEHDGVMNAIRELNSLADSIAV